MAGSVAGAALGGGVWPAPTAGIGEGVAGGFEAAVAAVGCGAAGGAGVDAGADGVDGVTALGAAAAGAVLG